MKHKATAKEFADITESFAVNVVEMGVPPQVLACMLDSWINEIAKGAAGPDSAFTVSIAFLFSAPTWTARLFSGRSIHAELARLGEVAEKIERVAVALRELREMENPPAPAETES
jgi:hypothetical protein